MSEFEKIYIQTELGPKAVLELLLQITEVADAGEITATNNEDAGVALSHSLVDSKAYGGSFADGYSMSHFGFTTNVKLVFYPKARIDRTPAQDWILKAALEFIEQTGWSMGVAFEDGQTVMLKYHNQRLVLNRLKGLWTPERLQMVRMLYEMEEIPIG